MREIRKKSVIPIYGCAGVLAVYCCIFPLYKLSHFIYLAAAVIASFFVLKKLFPGTVEYEPLPVQDNEVKYPPEIEALLKEGRLALSEMRRIRSGIRGTEIRVKIDKLIDVTDKIFKDLVDDPDDYPQIKRFSGYFLPATIKLLNAYDRMYSQGIEGENINTTMDRIEEILDTTILAFNKQLDALFGNQALDIETDITVLESMLKREGLAGKDF